MSSKYNDLISSGRSVSSLKAHLVLTSKYRKKIFNKAMLIRLDKIIQDLLSKWGCKYIEMNGEEDHVHLLFQYTPDVQLSKLVNNMKTVTSRYLRKEFEPRLSKFYCKATLWNGSYYLSSCGGVTIETLKKYVDSQNRPST